MNILVTGSSGFLGRRTVSRLVEQGHKVVGFDVTKPTTGPAIPFVQGDIMRLELIADTVKRHDIQQILHLAALTGAESEADPPLALKLNILGTNNVFECARLFGVERVVYASSHSQYGPQSAYGDRWVSEEDLGRPVRVYGVTKWVDDFMAAKYRAKYGLDSVGMRFSFVNGHGRRTGASLWGGAYASKPAVGEECVINYPADWRANVIYVDDALELLVRVLNKRKCDHALYNSGGYVLQLRDLADATLRQIPEARIRFEPEITENQYVWLVDNSRAREEFGWDLLPLDETVRRHIAEAREGR